jgi:hypothetical protein
MLSSAMYPEASLNTKLTVSLGSSLELSLCSIWLGLVSCVKLDQQHWWLSFWMSLGLAAFELHLDHH